MANLGNLSGPGNSVPTDRIALGHEPSLALGGDAGGSGGAPSADWASADLYRTLVDDGPDAIVVADRTGAIRLWNAAAARLFGYSAAEALGHSLDLIIPEPQRARHWEGYDRVMHTGSTRYGSDLLKVPALHRDGRRLSLEFRFQLLRGEAGAVFGVAAFLRDATEAFNERKALRARVAALEAAKKQ